MQNFYFLYFHKPKADYVDLSYTRNFSPAPFRHLVLAKVGHAGIGVSRREAVRRKKRGSPRPRKNIIAPTWFIHSVPSFFRRATGQSGKAMKKIFVIILLTLIFPTSSVWSFTPDTAYLQDREALEALQRDAFRYMWEYAEPNSGMPYEANFDWETRPVAVGGAGFGIAAIVTATDRGWITRAQGIQRLLKITRFLRDQSPRHSLHGAFPHWLNGATGQTIHFAKDDDGADIVETSLLMQGLLIARAYFNGPGIERELRDIITDLWEGVDWNWFTNGEERGIYWHWSPTRGVSGLRILGFNECLITYVLAIASPTHPITRKSYNYWTSGSAYKPKTAYGYKIEAALPNIGPLFLTHYSFIGLDPRRMADAFVPHGYFVRNVSQVLSNRAYCLENAPEKNRYSEEYWGLTASQVKGGYAVSEPANDTGTVAPTGALSSMPYTPHYSLQFLTGLRGKLRDKVWGPFGPYDAFNLRDNWFSDLYLAIDQLPIVCMVENYRSGLLWSLLMTDPDIRAGLRKAGISEPNLAPGFPEAVVTLEKTNATYTPDAYDIRRHPDTGQFNIPYWTTTAGPVSFTFTDPENKTLLSLEAMAAPGRNTLTFAQFIRPNNEILTLTQRTATGEEYKLPVRLH